MKPDITIILGVIVGFVVMVAPMMFRILREYERGVIFRLGRLSASKGPGLIFLIPLVDTMERVDLRTVTADVPTQDVITRDNVSVKVNAVVYYRVVSPDKAITTVVDYRHATSQMAQTKLRDVLGQVELDDLLSQRDSINERLQEILDRQTDPWGIKVSTVELKHVDLPTEMVRAMARQAEAERERRAKIISAEGEFQASTKLGEAADILERHPMSLQLRYLQTLLEIAGTQNATTTIVPLPIELIKPFLPRETLEPKVSSEKNS